MSALIVPRVHMNGDRKEALQTPLLEACRAIREAQHKLTETAPNARNYYVIGPEAFTRAVVEHRVRVQHLADVYNQLLGIYRAIDNNRMETEHDNY